MINLKKIRSTKRIGPHNKDIIDFIEGHILGESYLEKHGNGSRLCLKLEASNKAYLIWSHKFLAERGYCNPIEPLIGKQIGNKGKIRYELKIKTWTYRSLNEIKKKYNTKKKKIQPKDLNLTPFMLAIWIKNDGYRSGKGLKLATNHYTYEECIKQKEELNKKKLIVSIHKTGEYNKYNQYIHKKSKSILINIIKPYIHESKKYKLSL